MKKQSDDKQIMHFKKIKLQLNEREREKKIATKKQFKHRKFMSTHDLQQQQKSYKSFKLQIDLILR